MADDGSLVPKTQVELELEKAKIEAKRQRETTIGSLLDKAADVLSGVLDSTDAAMAGQRLRAAEVAINLYIQQDNGARQDRALELQQKRLKLEEEKLRQPGGPLFQQNNLYVQGGASQQAVPASTTEQEMLLARKQAQDAVLAQFLPQAARPIEEEEIAQKEQEDTVEPTSEDVLNKEEDTSGDKPQ